MNRLSIIALVGLAALQACSASDDAPERPGGDAGRDTKATTPRSDVQSVDQLDAAGGGDADDGSTPPPDPEDAALDITSPPMDGAGPRPDGTTPDSTVPPPNDSSPPPLDAASDPTVPSCVVSFTVNGVRWDAPEGGTDAQVTGGVVRLVGDAANIGSWTPTAGVLLAETSPGIWSGTATFRDQQLTEFKFVKMDGVTPEWEMWAPFDSNRSLRVECFGDGGTLRDAADAAADSDAFGAADVPADRAGDGTAIDASGDTGSDGGLSDGADGRSAEAGAPDANAQDSGAPGDAQITPVPARGKSYVGTFGVRPPDATK